VLPQPYALYSVALPGHDFDSSAESLQSVEEVARRCAEEIRANLHGPIALYGHCAGVAIAVPIPRRLEAAGATVEALFLGGALPGTAGRQRIAGWFSKFSTKPRPVGAADLLVHLRSLGGFTEIADPEELNFALRGYLHDDADAAQYFVRRRDCAQPRKLTAPIICLMGDRDPATRNYTRRYKEWAAFSQEVRLAVIRGGDHYFIKHHAAAVAQIIQATLEADPASK
jgi:surfactin synthase thioesterase subunit